ncbi:MAG: ROK family protein, partial [Clostridia bacterium]
MYVGIDVGGTAIKAGVVDEKGNIISRGSVESRPDSGEAMVRLMYTAMNHALDRGCVSRDKVTAVGIGSSGLCDNKRGTIIYSGNIAYNDTPVREFFMERIDARIDVDNDANCAAVGEYFATGEDCGSFVFVTLGTGVGGGIILNGRLLRGVNGGAGEIGHTILYPGGRKCGCGQNGCWEAYASVTGLIKDAKEKGGWFSSQPKVGGRTPFEGAAKGIPEAVEVRDGWIKNVAMGV